MKLSVIIPCLNAADTIGEQLEALAGQKWSGQWEVIVSDNGSKDDSLRVVEQLRGSLPELRIVDSSEVKGAAHARNVGCGVATGDAFLFCDADDVVAEGWMAAMAQALSDHGFVAGPFEGEKLNGDGDLQGRKVPQTNGVQKYDYPDYLPHAGGGNLGVKRAVHESVGGFDESLSLLEDTDYCWRIQLAGTKLHFAPEAVLHMRLRKGVGGSLRQARLWGKHNVLLYKRYRPLGMPKLGWRRGVKAWRTLLRQIPRIRSRLALQRWLWQVAWRFGRLEGCLNYRVLVP